MATVSFQMTCFKCRRTWISNVREETVCPHAACAWTGGSGALAHKYVPPEEIARRVVIRKAVAQKKGVPA